MCPVHFCCNEAKLPNLQLKTWPKQIKRYLPLDSTLPELVDFVEVQGIGVIPIKIALVTATDKLVNILSLV
jgi:hypothetical protein